MLLVLFSLFLLFSLFVTLFVLLVLFGLKLFLMLFGGRSSSVHPQNKPITTIINTQSVRPTERPFTIDLLPQMSLRNTLRVECLNPHSIATSF